MQNLLLHINIFFLKLTEKPIFIIKILNGHATKVAGSVKNSYLYDCTEITTRNVIKNALVYASAGNYGATVIKASSNVNSITLQQLRNAFSFR